MNLSSLLGALFAPLLDAAAAKIIHQAAGTAKGDNILEKDGAAIAAIKAVAAPYIAQQVGLHLANGTMPGGINNSGGINLGQFVPPSITFNSNSTNSNSTPEGTPE